MLKSMKRVVAYIVLSFFVTQLIAIKTPEKAFAETGTSVFSTLMAYSADLLSGVETNADLKYAEYKSPFNGNYLRFSGVDFSTGVSAVDISAAIQAGSANLEIRVESTTGPLLATVGVTATGSVSSYKTFSSPISASVSGVKDLYVVMSGATGIGTTQGLRVASFEFIPTPANDARLQSISVGGEAITAFKQYVFSYDIALKKSITEVPDVIGIKASSYANIETIPATGLPGTTKIIVTAQDGETKLTYNINFTNQTDDFILNYDFGPSVDAAAEGYNRIPETDYYIGVRGYGIKDVTPVTGKQANIVSRNRGSINQDALLNTSIIAMDVQSFNYQVDMPNGVYIVSLSAGDAKYASSCGVSINGNSIYPVTELIADTYLTVTQYRATVTDGKLVLSLERGKQNISLNYLKIESESKSVLLDLKVDGTTITNFSPQGTAYDCYIPYGRTKLPVLSYTIMYTNSVVTPTQATSVPGTANIKVVGSDSTTTIYTINFLVVMPTDVSMVVNNSATPLPLRYLGMNINYGSYFTGGGMGTKYMSDAMVNMGRYFVNYEYYNDSTKGDGVTDSTSFVAAKTAVKNNPFDNQYINWDTINKELLSGNPTTPVDSIGKTLAELKRADIEPLINFRMDSPNVPQLPLISDYPGFWEWWEHNFIKAYLCAKNYGVKEFNLFNEPQFVNNRPSNFLDSAREAADAIRAGARAAGVEPQIWGPTLYEDPATWGDIFMQYNDSSFDVYDFHSYKNDTIAAGYIDTAIARIKKYNSDGKIEPIAISEFNYQLNATDISHYEKMENILNTSRLLNMFVDKGVYAPIHFNLFRRYNRWSNALVNCTDATAQTFEPTKMLYAYRLLHRAFSYPREKVTYSLAGDTQGLNAYVTRSENDYYILLMNESKLYGHNYTIDLNALGISAGKAVLREVSDTRNDEVVGEYTITNGTLTASALPPSAMHLFVVPRNQNIPSAPQIYSTKTTDNGIELCWKNSENISYYDIERKEEGGVFTRIAAQHNNSYYTDTTAIQGEKYYYRVKAINLNGSIYSSEVGPLGKLLDTAFVMPYKKSTDPAKDLKDFTITQGKLYTNWWSNIKYRKEDVMLLAKPGLGNTNIVTTGPDNLAQRMTWKDYTIYGGINVTKIGTQGKFGLIGRYQDPNNYYRFEYNPNESTASIIKKVNGVDTVLKKQTVATVANGSADNNANNPADGDCIISKVTINGNRLDFYLRCNLATPQIVTVSDSDPIPYGIVGLSVTDDAQIALDDIGVEPLFLDDFSGGRKRVDWDQVKGTWAVTNDQEGWYVQNDATEADYTKAVTGYPKATDYHVETKFKINQWSEDESKVNLYTMYLDNQNYFRYSITKSGKLTIETVVNNVVAQIAEETVSIDISKMHRFAVQVEKGQHRVYVDGILKLTKDIYEPALPYGKVGVGTYKAAVAFDEFNLNGFLWNNGVGSDNGAVPAKPTGFAVAAVNTGELALSWDAVQGATQYRVYRADTANGNYEQVYQGTGITYTDKKLASSKLYAYKLSAINGAGESELSDVISATTLKEIISRTIVSTSFDEAALINTIPEGWRALTSTESLDLRTRYNITSGSNSDCTYGPLVQAPNAGGITTGALDLKYLLAASRTRTTGIYTLPEALAGTISVSMNINATNDLFKAPLEIYNSNGEIISKIMINDSDGTTDGVSDGGKKRVLKVVGEGIASNEQSGLGSFSWISHANKTYRLEVVINTQSKTQSVSLVDVATQTTVASAVDVGLFNSSAIANVKKVLISSLYMYGSGSSYTAHVYIDSFTINHSYEKINDTSHISVNSPQTGERITTLLPNATVTVAASIFDNPANSYGSGRGVLIAALYRNDGTVEQMYISQNTDIIAGQNNNYTIVKDIVLPENVTEKYLKCFVWDGLNNMKPIVEGFQALY